ncbi:E3 ubiquitin-protein ligase RING1 [Sorghum bicolor]|uniref:RING-type E3 ubiquitin transferase n=2 Tax=Sorghum bicolor TaxID=4558 RepID=C5XVM2_SORBI|nr:E3 ubiquitin-protein ligase RING1 [Sorghum bicolor]EES07019.1 hypothetical protein SORBI_3004G187800 [Sorghum bicolor]|eukprot:XP_002454043.1 E3 ubiquitin-protein ligase RING1 [Sorghum bicolor]
MGALPQPDPKNTSSCDDGQGPDPSCPPDDVPASPLPYPLPPPPPPPSPASHGRSTFVTALIIAVPVLAFLALCLSILIFVRRRRLRREALLEAAALAPAAPGTFPDDGDGGEGEVVHHAWHIRTVGLDDAAIESIALTRYRDGVLGAAASDCTVCLGEFQDGELLRLLPKCAHAFHVQCIDTWLRAHVSCPLCRADVMVDHAAAAAAAAGADAEHPPGGDAADAASAEQSASNTQTMELERPGQQANEQQELRVQIDQPHHSSSLSLELDRRPRRQIPRPGARARNFRRVASMDSPAPPTPEDEQAGGEKQQGTGGAVCVCCEVSPGPGRQLNRPAMKRSLSASSRWTLLSRHCRTRSSLLPL